MAKRNQQRRRKKFLNPNYLNMLRSGKVNNKLAKKILKRKRPPRKSSEETYGKKLLSFYDRYFKDSGVDPMDVGCCVTDGYSSTCCQNTCCYGGSGEPLGCCQNIL